MKAPVFFEMNVKGEGRWNMEALHQYKAGTVGETKIMVGKSFKELPSFVNYFRGYKFDMEQLARPEGFPKLNRDAMSSAEADYSIAFVEHIIAGD